MTCKYWTPDLEDYLCEAVLEYCFCHGETDSSFCYLNQEETE